MPRNSLHLLLTSVAAALVVAGSALLLPALSGNAAWLPSAEGAEGPGAPAAAAASADPAAASADPAVEARRAWEAKGEGLTAALTAYAQGGAEFAVTLVDNRTGLAFDYFGDESFESASVAKVDILAALLLRAQDENRDLTARELELATRMIGVSDNDAATTLYAGLGQAAGLTAANARIGLSGTVPVDDSWGLTTTTPNDQARLVGTLLGGDLFTGYSRETATGLMTSIDENQDWGISAAAAEGERTALKNGWLSRDTEDGEWIVNSVGRITGDEADLVLVVLSHGNEGYRTGVDHVEKVATMTREQLGV
ncbi:serine hydrolase [Catenuloplanes japonicus]|uniref:serine hydrolase n=1 Tax=Catenuloplanes japonicus TaxID=33876 RepID=UPI00069214DB|nr:serine hydrolase [Catenuloplanes japonicus]